MDKKIKRALVSVYHKDGLDDILRLLHQQGVELLSTGGTQAFIESLGIPCNKVEDVTGYPSILGGRVKTLHPKVFGGILGRRALEGDRQEMAKYEIPEIDLVASGESLMKAGISLPPLSGDYNAVKYTIVKHQEENK